MPITVTLPDNQTATLKDANELTNKEAKSLRRAARHAAAVALKLQEAGYDEKNPDSWKNIVTAMTDDEEGVLDEFQRACVATRLVSWTLDRPLPVDADEVDELPRPIFVPLTVAAADIKLTDEDFSADGATDPKAPIESSSN